MVIVKCCNEISKVCEVLKLFCLSKKIAYEAFNLEHCLLQPCKLSVNVVYSIVTVGYGRFVHIKIFNKISWYLIGWHQQNKKHNQSAFYYKLYFSLSPVLSIFD